LYNCLFKLEFFCNKQLLCSPGELNDSAGILEVGFLHWPFFRLWLYFSATLLSWLVLE
jgi:hypothetical protein